MQEIVANQIQLPQYTTMDSYVTNILKHNL